MLANCLATGIYPVYSYFSENMNNDRHYQMIFICVPDTTHPLYYGLHFSLAHFLVLLFSLSLFHSLFYVYGIQNQEDKIIQLYETMLSRHCTMVVGPTGGGKSTAINTLIKAQCHLGTPTKCTFLNPKVGICLHSTASVSASAEFNWYLYLLFRGCVSVYVYILNIWDWRLCFVG